MDRDELQSSVTIHDLEQLQLEVSCVAVSEPVRDELMNLVQSVRENRRFSNGLSPRAVLLWQRLAQARAYVHGRDFVIPDDLRDVAPGLLSLRIAGHSNASATIESILSKVPVAPMVVPSKAGSQ